MLAFADFQDRGKLRLIDEETLVEDPSVYFDLFVAWSLARLFDAFALHDRITHGGNNPFAGTTTADDVVIRPGEVRVINGEDARLDVIKRTAFSAAR